MGDQDPGGVAEPAAEELPPALAPAEAAFLRGDYAASARLAREVAAAADDEKTRAAAQKLAARYTIDPLVVGLYATCIAVAILVVAVWH